MFVLLCYVLDWESYSFGYLEGEVLNQTGRYLNSDELSQLTDSQSMIVECSLNGIACEFEALFSYKRFNCFRFKNYQTFESKSLELKAVLYTGKPLYISPQPGFYLFIENAASYPLLSTPILISTGYGRHIKVKRNSYNQYPAPYSECQVLEDNELTEDLFDKSIFDLVLATNYSYSRDICLTICSQLIYKKVCDCQAYDAYYMDGIRFCPSYFFLTTITCATRIKKANVSIFDFCMPRCPLECSRPAYRNKMSTYTYPSDYFKKYEDTFSPAARDFVHNQLNDQELSKFMYDTFIEFSISYDASANSEYLEIPKMSGEDLLGILGGHFHLFLGMSLMSFFEIFELLTIILLSKHK